MQSQLYIGTPNGVILCIDSIKDTAICGRLYHSYSREPLEFHGWDDAFMHMKELYDMLDFPRLANNERSFLGTPRHYVERKEWIKVMSDDELLNQHGYLDTFIVRVQHRENSTWQGRITWSDKNKTLNFRSIWEMVHLMEDAIASTNPEEKIEPQHWEDVE